MEEMRIEQLRDIFEKARARDEELQHAIEAFAADFLKEIGAGEKPVWGERKAGRGERQVNPQLIMAGGWLIGDLVVDVTPDVQVVLPLRIRTTKDNTHEVSLENEPSQSLVIDAPEKEHRDEDKKTGLGQVIAKIEGHGESNRKKVFRRLFAHLESEIRRRVELPAA